MSIELVSLAIPLLLLFLIAIGTPLAFATAATGILVGLILYGDSTFFFVPFRMYALMNSYVLIAVPLFLLMGYMLERGGVAEQLFRVMHVWAGPIHGGLAIGTIIVGMLLAALVGVIGAEIVTLGLVALPQMLQRGYDKKLSYGVICAAGSLGQLIPPSVVLILYALMANVPVGQVFAAALMPGAVLVFFYVLYVVVRCRLNPELGPLAPPEERSMPIKEKLALTKQLILPLAVAGAVLGSLYGGLATPTEAASVGVFGAFLAAFVNGRLNLSNILYAVKQTSITIGMLIWIFFGANAVISVYSRAGGISYLTELIGSLGLGPLGLVLLIMAILFVLGMFIDALGILVLTMPVFIPILANAGVDLVWFGIIFSLNMQISYLTPPFGPAVFYLKGVTSPETTLGELFASVWPFVGLQAITLSLMVAFPDIVLWIPELIK